MLTMKSIKNFLTYGPVYTVGLELAVEYTTVMQKKAHALHYVLKFAP